MTQLKRIIKIESETEVGKSVWIDKINKSQEYYIGITKESSCDELICYLTESQMKDLRNELIFELES